MNQKKHLPVLDGLRFFAALFVAAAHCAAWTLIRLGTVNALSFSIETLAGIGMSVFFVLIGFVIHYNYHQTCTAPGGKRRFFVARFARLYPLYILVFSIEFYESFHLNWGNSCSGAGDRWGNLFALPYYLTLTQAWFFGVICHNNLIYQYSLISQVTWSISVEVFFYTSYVVIVYWLVAQKNVVKQIAVGLLVNAAVLGYFILCRRFSAQIEQVALGAFGPIATTQNGYQDSFARWLNYFNPLVNLGAFVSGALAANIYMCVNDKRMGATEKAWGNMFATGAVIAVLATHFWLYEVVAVTNGFIGGTASSLYVPLVAVMIYCLARYNESGCSRVIGALPLVLLGEASYSIYLIHPITGWILGWRTDVELKSLHVSPWVLFVLSLMAVLLISRYSYKWFERPMQRWLRRKME